MEENTKTTAAADATTPKAPVKKVAKKPAKKTAKATASKPTAPKPADPETTDILFEDLPPMEPPAPKVEVKKDQPPAKKKTSGKVWCVVALAAVALVAVAAAAVALVALNKCRKLANATVTQPEATATKPAEIKKPEATKPTAPVAKTATPVVVTATKPEDAEAKKQAELLAKQLKELQGRVEAAEKRAKDAEQAAAEAKKAAPVAMAFSAPRPEAPKPVAPAPAKTAKKASAPKPTTPASTGPLSAEANVDGGRGLACSLATGDPRVTGYTVQLEYAGGHPDEASIRAKRAEKVFLEERLKTLNEDLRRVKQLANRPASPAKWEEAQRKAKPKIQEIESRIAKTVADISSVSAEID